MEDYLTGRRPHRKTTSQEDKPAGRRPHRKMTSQEDDVTGRRPHRKMMSQEDDLTGRRPNKKKTSHTAHMHIMHIYVVWGITTGEQGLPFKLTCSNRK